jgi:hypothetical protein
MSNINHCTKISVTKLIVTGKFSHNVGFLNKIKAMETQTENQIEWGTQRKGKNTRQKRDIRTEERIEGEKSSEHTTSKQSGL